MDTNPHRISAVPTTIVTGFLGAGKTSAILHLLREKPDNERWAVLVNEFGEIGIDGSLFSGQHSQQQGVFIREVPGGCMCCTAGLPMQIALNELLRRARPDRLLIEPTGLGHPEEVLQTLSGNHYREILDLQKVLTLVDARKLSDKRYTENETFNQQIAIADLVIGNKIDLYNDMDHVRLTEYIKQLGDSDTEAYFAQNGELPLSFLSGKTQSSVGACEQHHHNQNQERDSQQTTFAEEPIPKAGYIKATNQGQGFSSVGWRVSPSRTFCHEKLLTFLSGISAERMKAVFVTERGVFGYNLTPDALTEIELDDCMESRIEIIADQIDDEWESQLMAALIT